MKRARNPKPERFSRGVRFKSFWHYKRSGIRVAGHCEGLWYCKPRRKVVVDGKECLEFDVKNKSFGFRGNVDGRNIITPLSLELSLRFIPVGETSRIEARVKEIDSPKEIPEIKILEYQNHLEQITREARHIAERIGLKNAGSIEISFPDHPKLNSAKQL